MNQQEIEILKQAAVILDTIAGTPNALHEFGEANEAKGSAAATDASELIEKVLELRKKF